jgi:hypothetical protein
MADNGILQTPPIPVFIERKMTGIDPSNDLITSYKIKNSYCGILRLSPNSSATLIEDNIFDSTDNNAVFTSYKDSVADYLDSQFVRVSTSDGVMLDMRMTKNAIEYSNLYINGALKTSSGIIAYMRSTGQFKIGNLVFPTTFNAKDTNTTTAHNQIYVPITRENFQRGYILVNTAEDGMAPAFEYLNGEELISNFVADSMSNLKSLPAGSIHWVPITIAQYYSLLSNANNEHNGKNLNSDSIIRDFLLCDGGVYHIKDYPELAKVLYKEQVNYWAPESTADNASMILNSGDCVNTDDGTFRVPDFRAMFMQYLIPVLEKWNAPGNKAGDYEIDSNKHPKHAIDINLDKHYHYIVLDNSFTGHTHTRHAANGAISFGTAVQYNGNTAKKDAYGLDIFNTDGSKPLNRFGNGEVGTAATKSYSGGHGGEGCHQQACFPAVGRYGPSYVYRPYMSDRNCKVGSHTGGYFLSSSRLYKGAKNETLSMDDYHGISSYNISMQLPDDTLKGGKDDNGNYININTNLNYTNAGSIYKNSKEYVSNVEGMVDMYGKENTPEYFACLPLIKI